MPEGTIDKLIVERGFGFISAKGFPKGLFFHCSDLSGGDFSSLSVGQSVSFVEGKSSKGAVAYNVQLLGIESSPVQTRTELHDNRDVVLPYQFAPVQDKAISDTPVFHDGSAGEGLLSGELLCSLEALTPLLVGNSHYKLKEMRSEYRRQWGLSDFSDERTVIEPLFLPDERGCPKRVIISGTSLKGMLRTGLCALLGAPMERVEERHYTYRPNLSHGGKGALRECRAAIVRKVMSDSVELEVLEKAQVGVFLHGKAPDIFSGFKPGDKVEGCFFGVYWKSKVDRNGRSNNNYFRIENSAGHSLEMNHVFYSYKGGIDGEGYLAKAFNKNGRIHNEVLVKNDDHSGSERIRVDPEVYAHYLKTQKILAHQTIGHINPDHPLGRCLSKEFNISKEQLSEAIGLSTDLTENQLIYVEVERQGSHELKVTSMGHHYQYRWAFTSSIRTKDGRLRKELSPLPEELESGYKFTPDDKAPRQLSAARLLFGYVSDDKTLPIGTGAFERMAGRIAINHGVSQINPPFLGNEDKGYCVPLSILGSPKASAWEFYLKQNTHLKAPFITYGDLPDQTGGDLAGRKLYRHQPNTTEQDLSVWDVDKDSEQASIVRYACNSGTKFKFALRFSRLRPWELAAILAVLQPERLSSDDSDKQYAHKLGYGRPLGMGSVGLRVDRIRFRANNEEDLEDVALTDERIQSGHNELKERLKDYDLGDWLSYYYFDEKIRLGYPKALNHKKDKNIFSWHSNLHREYAELRRQNNPNWSRIQSFRNQAFKRSG